MSRWDPDKPPDHNPGCLTLGLLLIPVWLFRYWVLGRRP